MEINNCNSCNKRKPIVNKKYKLCTDCNRVRLHSEEPKKNYKIKQSKIKIKPNKKKKEYSILVEELTQERDQVCEGCGSACKPLSTAHILSRKQFSQYYLNKDNLIFLCFGSTDSCHEKWDSGNIDKMKSLDCSDKMFNFIKEKAINYYQKLMSK